MNKYEENFVPAILDYFNVTREEVIREKILGTTRADMLMLAHGDVVGVEIKSSHDSPKRMAEQLRHLCGVCRFAFLAVELQEAEKYAPLLADGFDSVGLLAFDDGKVSLHRSARENKPDAKIMFSFLNTYERSVCFGEIMRALPGRGVSRVMYERAFAGAPVPVLRKWCGIALRRAIRRRAECVAEKEKEGTQGLLFRKEGEE